jgi:hypothetical protein
MLRRTFALGSSLALLTVAGCQDQATAPTMAPTTASTSELVAQSKLGFDTPRARLSLLASTNIGDAADLAAPSAEQVVTPTACSASSPVNSWLQAEINRTIAAGEVNRLIELINVHGAADIPTYEALYMQTSATPQYYGYNGAFTKAIEKSEHTIKSFWDIPSSDIQVLAMHGDVNQDTARVAALYRALGESAADASAWAEEMRVALAESKTMKGDYAYWTFNAVSATLTEGTTTLKKIVMGDGILEAYAALGFADVAPQAIFAHEYAHQVQFANNYRLAPAPGQNAAERTRYTELHADAFAAYYMTHSRGDNVHKKRVEEFLNVFFQIGDCSFGSSGHHGTPTQRLAAARFGFEIADQAQKQGHILSAAQFNALFVARFPQIIAAK